jgi:hypothetical protein
VPDLQKVVIARPVVQAEAISLSFSRWPQASVSSFFLFQPMAFYPSSARPSDFFGIIHVFSFSIRRFRHNGQDWRYFSRNLQGGPVVPFGEVATLFIHVFPFLSGGGVTPPRPRYFFKPSPTNFTNQSSTSFRPAANLFAGNSIVLYRNCRWTQAGLSQMFTSRKGLSKYTLLAETNPC